jgi:DNA repair exonuclease SbcCD ATPase subunit
VQFAAAATADDIPSLASVGTAMGGLAAGLDARFVQAGTALASAYESVERLVSSLEGVTGAMNRQATMTAIDRMRLTADRLTRLPAEQSRRQLSLEAIKGASDELFQHLKQIRRTLSFLHICGLNIKVAAAGADGFAEFADHMFAKLEQAEGQVDEFEAEIAGLGQSIDAMASADRLLVGECAAVIPRVPQKLAADAQALQRLQDDSAELAGQIAALARDIRAKVAVALGALQIGDITRQRLEHIAEAVDVLAGHVAECEDEGAARQAIDLVTALLAAQAADTVEDFHRETDRLTDSLRGIAPDAELLADMQQGGEDGRGGDIQRLLHRLEQDIGEIASVTRQLCAAEADSAKLGQATSDAAESLFDRLKAVNRIQKDVEQMAWNTALQCRGLGADGRGLAVISEEIQTFSRHLAGVWALVSHSFDRIDVASRAIETPRTTDAQDGPDIGDMLMQSLDAIRGGSARMVESLSGVDREAMQIGTMLRDTTDGIGYETGIGPALSVAAEQLASLAEATDGASEDGLPPSVATVMADIAARYTMGRERDIHRAFVPGAEEQANEQAAVEEDDLFDDGLF